MKNHQQNSRLSKPYALLKTFSEEELNSFAELIKSNYLTDKEDPYLLLKSLRRYALPNSDKFTLEFQLLIFKDMYRDEIIFNNWCIEEATINKEEIKKEIDRQKKKLNKAMNDLLKLAETFLKFEAIRGKDNDNSEDDFIINYNIESLLPELRKRNQMSLYEKHLKVNEKKLSDKKKKDLDYHYNYYKIEVERNTTQFVKISNKGLAKKDNYKKLEYHLDVYYLLEKLRYHLAKITLNDKYAKKNFDYETYNHLNNLYTLPQYKNNILIKLYLLNVALVENKNDITYYELEKLVTKNRNSIPSNFLKPFYTNLSNYCGMMLRNGELKFYINLLKVYKEMHYNNVLIRYNTIRVGLLKNIVTVCCYNRKFSLAKKWLDHYITYVDESTIKCVYAFNKAVIEFSKSNFSKAHDMFLQVKKINNTYEIALKIYIYKCLYETEVEYYEATEQSLNSAYSFFSLNKKMTITKAKAYQNFISILLKLYKLNTIANEKEKRLRIKADLPKIIEKLNGFNFIHSKDWLELKIEKLNSYLFI